jgi:hypothetical protein
MLCQAVIPYHCPITPNYLSMSWLPSFVKLFLLFVAGFVLSIGAALVGLELSDSYTIRSIFAILRLIGLLLMVVSPLLMALKFFAQLDKKS